MATKNLSEYNAAKVPDASNMTFGIVVSEWNPDVTGALLEGCVNTLEKLVNTCHRCHVLIVPVLPSLLSNSGCRQSLQTHR